MRKMFLCGNPTEHQNIVQFETPHCWRSAGFCFLALASNSIAIFVEAVGVAATDGEASRRDVVTT